MQRALGKLPPRHDPRTLRLASYLASSDGTPRYQAPPPARDWADHSHAFDVLGNDKVGNCAFAAQAHLVQCFAAANGRSAIIGRAAVMSAYSRVTGYDPEDPATDRGTVLLDALGDWRKHGIDGHKIAAYVRVEPNRREIEAAINLCGGIYIGAALPLAAKSQTVWDVAPAGGYDRTFTPGTWGGHALCVVGYSRTGLVGITWGRIKLITWEWVFSYCDEMYATISNDWIAADDPAPNGFELERLRADLAAATANAR